MKLLFFSDRLQVFVSTGSPQKSIGLRQKNHFLEHCIFSEKQRTVHSVYYSIIPLFLHGCIWQSNVWTSGSQFGLYDSRVRLYLPLPQFTSQGVYVGFLHLTLVQSTADLSVGSFSSLFSSWFSSVCSGLSLPSYNNILIICFVWINTQHILCSRMDETEKKNINYSMNNEYIWTTWIYFQLFFFLSQNFICKIFQWLQCFII